MQRETVMLVLIFGGMLLHEVLGHYGVPKFWRFIYMLVLVLLVVPLATLFLYVLN